MCGIFGVAAPWGCEPSLDDGAVVRARDLMAHRGPDGAGLWRCANVVLAHRRLAVIDVSPAGAQPMVTADGRFAIVYNGELYNDAELRRELAAVSGPFATRSDTETVLRALAVWGPAGIDRLRGMYALALVDTGAGTVLLARDPMGIKPLYYARARVGGHEEIVFASEIPPILGHPAIGARPDMGVISAYLTTIRTTLDDRTLFAGVSTLRPGERLVFDFRVGTMAARRWSFWDTPAARLGGPTDISRVRGAVEDSVRRHLRADVPICCLLSGGLDSAVVAMLAGREMSELWTYCAGASDGEDFRYARQMAERLGSTHAEAFVTRARFGERWEEMVRRTGLPLSTPNEVAICEVASRLRADGKVVTISGEGADEVFGGYDAPLDAAAAFVALAPSAEHVREEGGAFILRQQAWVSVESKSAVLSEGIWRGIEGDAALSAFYRDEFGALAAKVGDGDLLQAFLRFQRRVNLAGLLARLDSATMLASVEGRTPLADQEITLLAEGLPMGDKFRGREGAIGGSGGSAEGEDAALRTKIALRRAFADDLPPEILRRPKMSFPLPFQEWMEDSVGVLRGSSFANELFTSAAIETVCAQPGRAWSIAWPMLNIARWAERWWG